MLGGADVQVVMLVNGDYQTDKTVAEAVIAMMAEAGIRVTINTLRGNARDAEFESGRFDWVVRRNDPELITPVQQPSRLAPVGPRTARMHKANDAGELDLLPFEERLVDTVNAFIASRDADERKALMQEWQKLYTENVYGDRADPVSGRADHQQALLEHPAGRADLHVQLGRGQHHPRAGLGRRGQAGRARAAPADPARRAGRRRPGRVAGPGCGGSLAAAARRRDRARLPARTQARFHR